MPGIGARGVDERDDGQTEFVRQFHQAQGFAIAFGHGGAEVAFDVLLGVAPFLRADEEDLLVAQFGQAAYQGRVIGEEAIPMQFQEIGKDQGGVIEDERPFGMAGDLDAVPRAEIGEDLAPGFLDLLLQGGDFLVKADARGACFRVFLEVFQLALQLQDRPLEIKLIFHQPSV